MPEGCETLPLARPGVCVLVVVTKVGTPLLSVEVITLVIVSTISDLGGSVLGGSLVLGGGSADVGGGVGDEVGRVGVDEGAVVGGDEVRVGEGLEGLDGAVVGGGDEVGRLLVSALGSSSSCRRWIAPLLPASRSESMKVASATVIAESPTRSSSSSFLECIVAGCDVCRECAARNGQVVRSSMGGGVGC